MRKIGKSITKKKATIQAFACYCDCDCDCYGDAKLISSRTNTRRLNWKVTNNNAREKKD